MERMELLGLVHPHPEELGGVHYGAHALQAPGAVAHRSNARTPLGPLTTPWGVRKWSFLSELKSTHPIRRALHMARRGAAHGSHLTSMVTTTRSTSAAMLVVMVRARGSWWTTC